MTRDQNRSGSRAETHCRSTGDRLRSRHAQSQTAPIVDCPYPIAATTVSAAEVCSAATHAAAEAQSPLEIATGAEPLPLIQYCFRTYGGARGDEMGWIWLHSVCPGSASARRGEH